MEVLIALLFILYFVSCVLSPIFFSYIKKQDIYYYGSPKYIYNNSTLNVFGTLMLSLIILFLAPIYYLLWLIYWLCHVGRR